MNRSMLEALVACSLAGTAIAKTADESPGTPPAFAEKVVMFEVDRSTTLEQDSDSVTLFAPKVMQIGDKSFVYGEVYVPPWWAEENGAVAKRFRGVASDRIIAFYAFEADDFDEYARERWSDREDD